MPSASMSTTRACGSNPPRRPSAYFRVLTLTIPCRTPTEPRLPMPRGLPSSLPSTLKRSLPLSSMTNRGRRSRNSGSMYLSRRSSGSRMWPWAYEKMYVRVIGNPSLLRGRRERRQLADVAHVVLDDDGRFEICDDLLHALDRGDRRGAVEVEVWHAATLVVLAEVDEVAGEQHRAHVLQPDQQAAMARRVTRHPQNDHAAVAEHVLVPGQRLDLPAFADPALEARGIGAWHRRRGDDPVPVAFSDEQRGVGERLELAGMVAVKVADADVLDLLGCDRQLLQAINDTDLRGAGVRAGFEAGVPHHVFVAMLDQVAAEREGQLEVVVGKGIGEALADVRRRGAGAAVDAGQRDFGGRLRHRRQADENVGAQAEREQNRGFQHGLLSTASRRVSGCDTTSSSSGTSHTRWRRRPPSARRVHWRSGAGSGGRARRPVRS